MKLIFLFYLLIFSLRAFSTQTAPPSNTKPIPLPALNIQRVALAGISSGAFMAIQYQIAYPEDLIGVGSLAGGTWNCSQGKWQIARDQCMKQPDKIDLNQLFNKLENLKNNQQIGNLNLIKNHRIFLFQGQGDTVINPKSVDHLKKFLDVFSPTILKKSDINSGHGYPTLKTTQACDQNQIPWLVNCNYDLSAEMLTWFFGPLENKEKAKEESLWAFDQNELSSTQTKVADNGHIYIPQACHKKSCDALIMLHGCLMGPALLGTQFIHGTELNDWAEANNLVVVYPATTRSLGNPNGCWDWFAYTGEDFLSRSAPQILFLNRIIMRLRAYE